MTSESRLDHPGGWTGHWWLPDDPETVVPGILRYDPADGLDLTLIGGFDARVVRHDVEAGVSYVSATSRTWDVVHGVAENREITLLDCIPTSSTSFRLGSGPPHKQSIVAQTALVGVHVLGADDAVFTACSASIENLTAWSADSVFSHELRVEDEEITGEATIRVLPIENPAVTVDDTKFVLLRTHTLPHFTDQRGRTRGQVQETALIRFTPESPMSLATAHERVQSLRDLISLATHRAAGLISMTLRRPPAERPSFKGRVRQDREVAVLTRQIVVSDADAEAARHHELLFTCDHLPFDTAIPRWFEMHARCAAATNMMLSLRYAPNGYVEPRLLIAVGAAEVLHRALDIDEPPIPSDEFTEIRSSLLEHIPDHRRGWFKRALGRNDPTLRERLSALDSIPDSVAVRSLIPDTETFVRAAVQSRNDLAHTGQTGRLSIDELIAVTEACSALVTLCLLQQLGVTGERQQQVVLDNPGLRFAADQAAEHLMPPASGQ